MLTRSLPSVALATVHPVLGSPTTSSSGTNRSLKNTSLKSEPPVICRSGRTSTSGAFMSTITVVMPACLRRLRIGAHGGQAARAVVRPAGPHLLPVDLPAAVHPGGFGLDRRRVRAGVGLGEQLAPDLVFAQRLLDESLDLPIGSVLDEGQDHPSGDAVVRSLDARGPKLLLDDQLLDRVGGPSPRLGPVRHHVAGLDQLVALRILGQCGDLGGVLRGSWCATLRPRAAGPGCSPGLHRRRCGRTHRGPVRRRRTAPWSPTPVAGADARRAPR